MSSANKHIAVLLFLIAGATYVIGCHSSANPPPVAAGGRPIGVYAPNSSVNGTLYHLSPVDDDPVSVQDGRRLFVWYNCSGCHGTHGGGAIGPSLRDPVWRYGSSDAQIFNSIAQGRPQGMPTWGAKIPEIQIWELVAYIKSLGTSREPDPPLEPADEAVNNPLQYSSTAPGTPIARSRRQ